MTGSYALMRQPRAVQLRLANPRTLLAAVLLVLLSGLPQICIGLTAHDFAGERISALPVTRSVLIDKLLPEVASITPPHLSDFPLSDLPPRPFSLFEGYEGPADEPKPSQWLLNLTQRLYRHHSSFV